jgi:hypothetical protein
VLRQPTADAVAEPIRQTIARLSSGGRGQQNSWENKLPNFTVSDLSPLIERLTLDETWQAGLDEDERRLCIGFVVDALIVAKNHGWNVERMYDRVVRAVKQFSVGGRREAGSGRQEAGGERGRAVDETSVDQSHGDAPALVTARSGD